MENENTALGNGDVKRQALGAGSTVCMYSGEAYLVDGQLNARERELGVQDICRFFLLSSRRSRDRGNQEQGVSRGFAGRAQSWRMDREGTWSL